ncbi:hypothetical protein SLNWT_2264 [Streptomyces albus]|uniref:Uncharacterized protein n=1 Tax=Streptomyces albus (strain ATCC 21838 / DSM 41398 / FERM P-419 / JCM 4703 / NBRC 107858) TaxID=1081613 RepID=A0A0B5ETS0_STRA4|nr:hypothetical protein SLNWT_2264 [Streptomyces albus]AOU76953.1 hypothetical protein SLNHY_2262 [Streptomyces albus]
MREDPSVALPPPRAAWLRHLDQSVDVTCIRHLTVMGECAESIGADTPDAGLHIGDLSAVHSQQACRELR